MATDWIFTICRIFEELLGAKRPKDLWSNGKWNWTIRRPNFRTTPATQCKDCKHVDRQYSLHKHLIERILSLSNWPKFGWAIYNNRRLFNFANLSLTSNDTYFRFSKKIAATLSWSIKAEVSLKMQQPQITMRKSLLPYKLSDKLHFR